MFIRIITISLLIFSISLFAEDGTKYLEKNLEARGGIEKLNNVTSMEVTGSIFSPQANQNLPIHYWYENPEKYKLEQEIMGQKIVISSTNNESWQINPMMGSSEPTPIPPAQINQFKSQLLQIYDLTMGIKSLDSVETVEYIGIEDFEGSKVNHIKLLGNNDEEIHLFIDAISNMIKKMEVNTTNPQNNQAINIVFLYKSIQKVDGIIFPKKIEIKVDGNLKQRIEINSIAINADIDNAVFAMPTK